MESGNLEPDVRAADETGSFGLSPYFSDSINRNVVESEILGGVNLRDVPPDTVIEVETQNHTYTIVHKGWGQALISGHPDFCPDPVLVEIHGSTWGGSLLKQSYIGRGMHLEFRPIITSRILEVRAR